MTTARKEFPTTLLPAAAPSKVERVPLLGIPVGTLAGTVAFPYGGAGADAMVV